MARRIVLFGATGYTGRLTLAALLRRGLRPLLAARSATELERLAERSGGELDTAVADATAPGSLDLLLRPGDVIVSTVGPFGRWGDAAVEAAIGAGAHYLDSNGEPLFTRQVFERHGPQAQTAGVGLLTAFGWESVAGNLAGALALREAAEATRVDTGYFYRGSTRFSAGTRASFAAAMVQPSFAFRAGALRTVPGGERYRTFAVGGARRPAVALGASEHLALPRAFPRLREVNAYLGWFGGLSPRVARPVHLASRVGSPLLALPGLRRVTAAALERWVGGASGGPTAGERAAAGVDVVAIAYDPAGTPRARVHLRGIEGYELTAELLAWAAGRVVASGLPQPGALGPLDAFGLAGLEAGCREAGLSRAEDGAGEAQRAETLRFANGT